jgi:hypothetical protein
MPGASGVDPPTWQPLRRRHLRACGIEPPWGAPDAMRATAPFNFARNSGNIRLISNRNGLGTAHFFLLRQFFDVADGSTG